MKTLRQMHKCWVVFLLLPLILHGQGQGVAGLNGAAKPGIRLTPGNFEENRGQIRDQYSRSRPDVLFSGNTGGMVYHISAKGISYQMNRVDSWQEEPGRIGGSEHPSHESRMVPDGISTYRVDLNWLNANYSPTIQKGEALPGYTNYYNVPNGLEPALFVRQYADVTFKEVWAGVDLHYYSKDGILESDWLIHRAADYQQILFEVSGAELSIAEDGWLVMQTPFGEIREGRLRAYQGSKAIPSAWKIEGSRVSFKLFDYDQNLPVRIDPPVRIWGTMYGGNLDDYGYSCAVDAGGNVYLAGTTKSTNLVATTGAHQTTHGNPYFPYGTSYSYDGFLVKFNQDGVRLWGTYYGGDSADWVYSCAVDMTKENGEVYIAGTTMSSNAISTLNAHQDTFGGKYDAFLVKFNHLGIRQWGTYYGSDQNDFGYSCAVDKNGNVLLAGATSSTAGIATEGSHQPTFNGGDISALLVKFFPNGIRQWGTYYGVSGITAGYSCTTDLSGNIFLCGSTNWDYSIATPGAHQTVRAGGYNAILVKFNPSGVRQWGTYYGGNLVTDGYSCGFDISGNVYMAGCTESTFNIASPGAYRSNFLGPIMENFLVKFDSNGVRLWGTYYGGFLAFEVFSGSCSIDPSGYVYLLGITTAATGIATPGAFQDTISYAFGQGFMVKFNTNGVRDWGTYIRGKAESCVMDPFGNLYLSGRSNEGFMATPGSYQSSMGNVPGYCDAFLVRFSECSNYLNISVQPQDQQVITGQQAHFVVSTSSASATYQWQTDTGNGFQNLADTGQYSGATTDTLIITNVGFGNQNQMFRCIVKVLSCSDTSVAATLTVVTGIDEPVKKPLFSVYPNPAEDQLIIQSEYNVPGGETFELMDMYGRVLMTGDITFPSTIVDVGRLSRGMGILCIRNATDSTKETFKIVLQ